VTDRPTAPTYRPGETVRALYLLMRGAGAAIRGQDPAGSRWDRALTDLADQARQREQDGPDPQDPRGDDD
jgi:hypothetical protein